MQHTSQLLMIRPVDFGFNEQTAVNNHFQQASNDNDAQLKAAAEFDGLVQLLRNHGIDVLVIDDTPVPHTPDSIFPNNWISFHDNGHLYLYPMFAPNRRKERKQHVLDAIDQQYQVSEPMDLSVFESEERFLEGTGSMVLDRDHRIAYACLSPRTDKTLLELFCQKEGYRAVLFHAVDQNNSPIYHTNVMMCVADAYAVICLDSIVDPEERKQVTDSFTFTHKRVIGISSNQMDHFAGNMLQVHNKEGKTLLVMSTQAYRSLTPTQIKMLEQYNPIIHAPIPTIETLGGGSVRCMLAEIFLPERTAVSH
jgi:hypothetical protein